MVLVANKKYACETCIKGHRSSTCKHAGRPLFEIKKKGRPVTQCEHCRELRKTKQVHVKCMCSADSLSRKGTSLLLASATFPSGLTPEVLEASAALASSSSDASESEHSSTPCDCDNTGRCGCATPRKSTRSRVVRPRPRRASSKSALPPPAESEPPVAGPAGIVASAHAGGHRPVLPRPPSSEPAQSLYGSHDLSASYAPAHSSHLSPHAQHYSPYERAYEHAYPVDAAASLATVPALIPSSSSSTSDVSDSPSPANTPPDFDVWSAAFDCPPANAAPAVNASLCSCHPACACPSCPNHRGQGTIAGSPCAETSTCGACLECAMLALPPSTANTQSYSIPDVTVPMPDIDGWLRAMTTLAVDPFLTLEPTAAPCNLPVSVPEPDVPYDTGDLRTYALWHDLAAVRAYSSPALGEWDADMPVDPVRFC